MRYVLDGIETAMEEQPWSYHTVVVCDCGFEASWSTDPAVGVEFLHRTKNEARAALRFHYTHCPKARKTPPTARTNVGMGTVG